MTFANKIEIDILDFIRTARFDYLKLGQAKEWIINNFPDPDDIGLGTGLMNAKIWFYGNIELHFEQDQLFLIHSENITDLDGGKSLTIKKWIFEDPSSLVLTKFIERLNTERIDFSKKTELLDLEYVRLKVSKSNVQLTFIDEERNLLEPNKYRLSAFSLSRE